MKLTRTFDFQESTPWCFTTGAGGHTRVNPRVGELMHRIHIHMWIWIKPTNTHTHTQKHNDSSNDTLHWKDNFLSHTLRADQWLHIWDLPQKRLKWWGEFASSPWAGQIVCHMWVPQSADTNFLMNSIFHSPPFHHFSTPPSLFLHCPADHNKARLINLGWAAGTPWTDDSWLDSPSLLGNFGCLLGFVPLPCFHLLNNMSVVGSFIKRNRYSTEASECGKEDVSLLNLIWSKCVRVYTHASISLSAFMFLCYSWSPSRPAQLSPSVAVVPLSDCQIIKKKINASNSSLRYCDSSCSSKLHLNL